MDINEIEKICGPVPQNYEAINPDSENFIFQNDPNFNAINLYDFFGNGATVNSFSECAHYVNGGWEPFKTTIFDIGAIILYIAVGAFSAFKIYKYFQSVFTFEKLKSFFNTSGLFERISNQLNRKEISIVFYTFFFFVQSYFLFDYIRTKSVRIPRFIDEYISLTSNLNFFKNLNFNAGEFIGGSYSTSLTSGPVSAIGSVFAWNITDKLTISRISNFFWVYLLQIFFAYLIVKLYKSDFKFLFFISGLSLVLIPWWQGSLYSLGEIPSVIIFINAIFLFPKIRKLSLLLFSISIFYGKLLNLVPFVGFYVVVMFNERKIKKVINDFIMFLIPLSSWLFFANSRYGQGNAFQYIKDQYFFIINHQSSGASMDGQNFIDKFIHSFTTSEFIGWNIFDKTRLTIIPILFLYILYKNREDINKYFGEITIPFMSSFFFVYLWFWILNSTKWMRHTQHYTILLIIGLVYLLNFNVITSKVDLVLSVALLAIFIDNNKYLIFCLIVFSILVIYYIESASKHSYIKFLIALILFIDISLPYFEKDTFGNLHHIIEDCKIELISEECKSAYLNTN